jgi:DNA mismatch repair protein MutL
VPARRKFLKSETTEAAHVDHEVRLHALASTGTRFVFRKDGRSVFDIPGTGDRRVRIADLAGRELLGQLRELQSIERRGVSLGGYLLPPSGARASRRGQHVILNGRPIDDVVVSRALAEGFRGALPAGRHPVAWLWIEMEPELVDVNVHPAKREVRFHRPADLRSLIVDAVEQTLKSARPASVPRPARAPAAPPVTSPEPASAAGGDLGSGPMATGGASAKTWRAEIQQELAEADEAPLAGKPAFRVIGALTGRYVLLEASDGLVLLDPRAARERILYELFLANAGKGAVETQGLLVPVLVELDARDADVVLRNAENFREAGMEVESFGGTTLQLLGVPGMLAGDDAKSLLLELVDALVETEGEAKGKALTFERFAARLARVGGRGERCSSEAAAPLLDELFACDLPYCTHDGRPTLVQIADQELDRKFGKART